METLEQKPWIKYLEINEKTGERILKKDTPKEIKKAYELYLKGIKKIKSKNIPITK